jgi:trimeric autotransporter adhesin
MYQLIEPKKATPLFLVPLVIACFAFLPQMQAVVPAPDGCYPGFTTAEGCRALESLTTGTGNTGLGFWSLILNTDGNNNTGVGAQSLAMNDGSLNTAVGVVSLVFNMTGNENTAVGAQTLPFNDGDSNGAFGAFALFNNTTGSLNNAFGEFALSSNDLGGGNTAVGFSALSSSVNADGNTAVGTAALFFNDATGNDLGIHNTAVGSLALIENVDAENNTAMGFEALLNNDLTGNGIASDNTAVGAAALVANIDGAGNTAVGSNALAANIGGENTAVGDLAAAANTNGAVNTAVGSLALTTNTTGTENTAVGRKALQFLDGGHENVAVGWGAGINYTGTETNNICIGDQTAGVAGESNAIRIGDNSTSFGIDLLDGGAGANFILIGTGMGTQGISVSSLLGFGTVQMGNGLSTVALASSCNIGGIYNQTFGPADMAVRIGSDNKLGTVVSSRRFKHDIEPIDKASEAILALKPVTFHYNSDSTNTPRFGLIAEDVAEVSSELVIPDKEGKPLSVRYEDVNVMLLNEFLKEHKKVQDLEVTVAQQQKGMEILTAQLKEQAAQIQKVSAQVEVNKPAPQVVTNKP